MKLTIKTYSGNCTVFGDEGNCMIYYSGDDLAFYGPEYGVYSSEKEAVDGLRNDFKEEILLHIPGAKEAENLDDIVETVMIYARETVSAMWSSVEEKKSGYSREAALAVPEFENELKAFTVKELRRVTGMTQKAFAEFFEIPERSIENWEGGQRECPDYLLKLMLYRIEKEKGIEIPRFFVCEQEDGNGWEYAFLTREQALDKAEEYWSRLTKRERKGFVDRNKGAHFCVICGYYIPDEDIYAFGRKETNVDWDNYYGDLADFDESDV